MTFLRYFIPLVKEGNKRGIQSCFYVGPSNKYNCPTKHRDTLAKLAGKYKIRTKPIRELHKATGLCFFIEGVGLEHLQRTAQKQTRVSITYTADYRHSYDKYIDYIDFCLFPAAWQVEEAVKNKWIKKLNKEKTITIGTPKLDDCLSLDKDAIFEKYNLQKNAEHCLIVLPKSDDFDRLIKRKSFDVIISFLRSMDYKILTKNRGKERYRHKNGDLDIIDGDWYPHPTMELIKVSDLVINFDSAAIEECLALKTKMINFNVKKNRPNALPPAFPVLYNPNFCVNIEQEEEFSANRLRAEYEKVSNTATDTFFNKFITDHLGKIPCSEVILDYFIS